MNTPQQENPNNTSIKRRSLIKGTASAVPVVLTLRSGAAFATDSAGACVARTQQFLKDNPSNAPEVLVEAQDLGSDNWVRVVTTGRVITKVEDKTGPITGGKSFVVFRDPEFPEGDPLALWYKTKFNTQNGKEFTDEKDPTTGALTGRMQNKSGNVKFSIDSEANDCNILCLVDSEGNPFSPPTYGAAFDNGEFPFATTSCINSMNSII